MDLLIFSAAGDLAISRKNIPFPAIIDPGELRAGIFYVQIISGQKVYNGTLLKE